MKKTFFLFFGLLAALNLAYAGDPLRIIESMSMQSRILSQEVRFSVCLPVDYYKTKQAYPVVYLLHGLGDDETSWLEYGRISQYAALAEEAGEIVPMIFVMPQGFRSYYVNDYKGSFRYQDMFVSELVPFIDSLFRTVPKKSQRAVMGYSMGGFGAFMLPLKYPDLFGVSVPLSMSVRTDAQYMTEDAKGWDEQWGRLFEAPGLKDSARLTSYYRRNTPFHFVDEVPDRVFKSLRIYMDNGDDEQTLCRSNEELNILLHKKKIAHEYRVRNGGHSFDYWCSALPSTLRFISDAFEEKPYRGDHSSALALSPVVGNQVQTIPFDGKPLTVIVPPDYEQGNRTYPVFYLIGNIEKASINSIASSANHLTFENTICPMILVFLPVTDSSRIKAMIPVIETRIRIRKGYRFRAFAGFREGASIALSMSMDPGQSCCGILSDGILTREQATSLLTSASRETLKKTGLFIEAPDKGSGFEGNGNLHMILRDKDVQHEYRVREGKGGIDWFIDGLPEVLRFTTEKFHK